MAVRKNRNTQSDVTSSIDESVNKKQGSTTGNKPKSPAQQMSEDLEDRVMDFLIKYQGERKDTREDIAVVLGKGGENLDGFIDDYQNNYRYTVQPQKVNRKQKTKTDVLLRPVSESKVYNQGK